MIEDERHCLIPDDNLNRLFVRVPHVEDSSFVARVDFGSSVEAVVKELLSLYEFIFPLRPSLAVESQSTVSPKWSSREIDSMWDPSENSENDGEVEMDLSAGIDEEDESDETSKIRLADDCGYPIQRAFWLKPLRNFFAPGDVVQLLVPPPERPKKRKKSLRISTDASGLSLSEDEPDEDDPLRGLSPLPMEDAFGIHQESTQQDQHRSEVSSDGFSSSANEKGSRVGVVGGSVVDGDADFEEIEIEDDVDYLQLRKFVLDNYSHSSDFTPAQKKYVREKYADLSAQSRRKMEKLFVMKVRERRENLDGSETNPQAQVAGVSALSLGKGQLGQDEFLLGLAKEDPSGVQESVVPSQRQTRYRTKVLSGDLTGKKRSRPMSSGVGEYEDAVPRKRVKVDDNFRHLRKFVLDNYSHSSSFTPDQEKYVREKYAELNDHCQRKMKKLMMSKLRERKRKKLEAARKRQGDQ